LPQGAMEKAAAAAAEEEPEEAWAWTWGAGTDGQLGNGGFQDHHLPQALLLPPRCRGRVSFVAGGGAHAIALTSDGEVFTWGRGTHGQLGHGNIENIPHPKSVKFFENYTVTCVSTGWNHSGFATDSGQLFMCGDGSFGQLGTGDNQSRNLPFEATSFTTKHVEKLAFGMRHSLVLLKGGELYAIGAYRHQKCDPTVSENAVARQLNLTTASSIHHEPSSASNLAKVPSIHGQQVTQIAAGTEHSALVTESGALFTWGWGEHGQLGLGDTCDQVVPQRVNLGDEGSRSYASLGVYCGSGFTVAVSQA
uniref:RCC1-like domain-containing protein n=1 Tax=Aegilops tauschii subsp. strangulata TaxID=200361 RepID=A0A453FNY6_AEGTS